MTSAGFWFPLGTHRILTGAKQATCWDSQFVLLQSIGHKPSNYSIHKGWLNLLVCFEITQSTPATAQTKQKTQYRCWCKNFLIQRDSSVYTITVNCVMNDELLLPIFNTSLKYNVLLTTFLYNFRTPIFKLFLFFLYQV